MNCPVPMTAWSPAFLLSTSLVFCVDYTQSLPSVRQWEMWDVWVSAQWLLFPLPASASLHTSPHMPLPVRPFVSPAPGGCRSLLSAFEHRCHELLCLKFWCVMGCFHQCQRQLDPAVTSTGQFITFAHTGQPCNSSLSKILQFLPIKIVAKKKGKSYDRHIVDD